MTKRYACCVYVPSENMNVIMFSIILLEWYVRESNAILDGQIIEIVSMKNLNDNFIHQLYLYIQPFFSISACVQNVVLHEIKLSELFKFESNRTVRWFDNMNLRLIRSYIM